MIYLILSWALFGFDFGLRIYFSFRIIQRKLSVGVSWAWLSVILFLPLFGTIIYLYLGEYRLGRRRAARLKAAELLIQNVAQNYLTKNPLPTELPEPSLSFAKATEGFFGQPLLLGNDCQLLNNADEAFPQMIADIDNAKSTCDMVFYIWSNGGRADEFGEALVRAAQRKVRCRVLVDQVGSAAFLKSPMAARLKEHGVEIKAALSSSLLKSLFARPDLRVHRKILIVDGSIAFSGSLNLADPQLFKIDAGVGQWVDALCRLRGPVVKALGLVFLSDWSVESGIDFSILEKDLSFKDTATQKNSPIQCLPSGPAINNSIIEQTIVTALYSARQELTLTTPYFVPSESLQYALVSAAHRGVKVTLIVPEFIDSKLTQYASRAFLAELVESGVNVHLFQGGLLHTKSITVDGRFCLFGSVNLDPRSFRINFEITLAIYDLEFIGALSKLQATYLGKSRVLEASKLLKKPLSISFKENLARLIGPLL